MRLPTTTTTDTRSPWYEAFTPPSVPAVWTVASPEEPAPAPQEQADDHWAMDALFDYYNEE